VKVDAARRDERRPARVRRRAERQREGGHRNAVRIVGVHDVGLQPANDPRQLPAGGQIDLAPRRQRNQLEAFRGPLAQLTVRMRNERRAMPDRPQAIHGEQHLVLPSAPGAGGVDVKRKHKG